MRAVESPLHPLDNICCTISCKSKQVLHAENISPTQSADAIDLFTYFDIRVLPGLNEDKDEGYDAFAADVWATGIVLWCFLFGELPYHSLDAESLFESISSGVPKIPSRKSPECEDILSKMLTYDAEKRISFNELLKHIWITEHDEAESESNVNVAKNMKSKLLKLKSHASGTVTERRRSLKFQKEESIQKLSQKLKSESLIQISETAIEAENINNEEIKKDHIQNEKVNNVCCVII